MCAHSANACDAFTNNNFPEIHLLSTNLTRELLAHWCQHQQDNGKGSH